MILNLRYEHILILGEEILTFNDNCNKQEIRVTYNGLHARTCAHPTLFRSISPSPKQIGKIYCLPFIRKGRYARTRMSVIDCIQILALSYLLGSVPFGVLLAKLFRLPDPRYIGSGNIGATNMLRTGRKDVAILTLLLDTGKGAAAVIIADHLFHPAPAALAFAALCAAVGHMYSPWLKFKGGKGMATLLGAGIAFAWPVGMSTLMVWVLVCYTTRYVSLASITALALMPCVTWLRIDGTSALVLAGACAIAIWRHRENIGRLRRGFEPRVNFGKRA